MSTSTCSICISTTSIICRLIFILAVFGQISEGFVTNSFRLESTIAERHNRNTQQTMKRRTMLSLAATSALAKATATTSSSPATNYLSLRSHPQRNIRNYNILQAFNSESDITHLVSRFPPRGGASVRNAAATSKPSLSKTATPFSSTVSASSSTALFASAPGEEAPTECPFTKFAATFGGFWGSFGVIYILTKAIARVLPIAMEPFHAGSSLVLSPIQWR